MAYYYVMTDGAADGTAAASTDDGRFATKQTGAFSALDSGAGVGPPSYYPDIVTAMAATTAPGAGDYICCADTHNFTTATVSDIDYTGSSSGAALTIISVDKTAVNTPKAGATEAATDSAVTIEFQGLAVSVGVDYTAEFNIGIGPAAGWSVYNATLTNAGTVTRQLLTKGDGACLKLHDSTWATAAVNTRITCNQNTLFEFHNVIFSTTAANMHRVFSHGSTNGGTQGLFIGCDLSALDHATASYLMQTQGGDRAVDDAIDVTCKSCKLHANLQVNEENFESLNQRVSLFNCGSTSAEAEYQFHIVAFGGEVEDDTAIWRGESVPFPSNMYVSAKVTTVGNVSKGTPFSFELPARYCDFTTYDKLRIHLCSTTALTQELTWAELIYRDQTNNHTPIRMTSQPTDFLSSGTALTSAGATANWVTGDQSTEPHGTELTGYNEYYIEFDVQSNDPGCDCIPSIILHCGEAAGTIVYIDTSVELV